jgi:hypothetical protein
MERLVGSSPAIHASEAMREVAATDVARVAEIGQGGGALSVLADSVNDVNGARIGRRSVSRGCFLQPRTRSSPRSRGSSRPPGVDHPWWATPRA